MSSRRSFFYNYKAHVDLALPSQNMLFKKLGDIDIVAEYTLRNIETPIGVSSVEIYDQLTADYKSSLPTIEEIEAQLKDKED